MIQNGLKAYFHVENGVLKFRGKVYIPLMVELRYRIHVKAYSSLYTTHFRDIKMYQDFKRSFWWSEMKRDIGEYVAKCLTY